MPVSQSPTLFLSSGADRTELLRSLAALGQEDFAQAQATDDTVRQAAGNPLRAGIIADSSDELAAKISQLRERLGSDANGPADFRTPSGVYFGDMRRAGGIGKTAFLFPGFGSQYPGMLGRWRRQISGFDSFFAELDSLAGADGIGSGQPLDRSGETGRGGASQTMTPEEQIRRIPACLLSSVLLQETLKELGVSCDMAMGYSVGELAALICGGYIKWDDRAELLSLLQRFGHCPLWADDINTKKAFRRIAVNGEFRGALKQVLEAFSGRLSLQFDNSTHNAILYGKPQAIEAAADQLNREAGIVTMALPYMEPLHTSWYQGQAEQLAITLADLAVVPGNVPLLSGTLLDFFPVGHKRVILERAGHQWTHTVRFHEALTRLTREGVRSFVEVGPGAMLTGFVTDTVGRGKALAVATDKQGVEPVRQLQTVLAEFFLRGAPVRPDGLRKRLALSSSLPEAVSMPERPDQSRSQANALSGHFSLMREFLGQQQRLMLKFTQQIGARTQSAVVRQSADSAASSVPAGQKYPDAPIRLQQNGGQTAVEWQLDAASHRFLRDHSFGRVVSERQPQLRPLPVLPFTASVEYMARSAVEGAGHPYRAVSAENVSSLQWITADTGQLRLRVVVREQKRRAKVVELQPEERVFECELYTVASAAGLKESSRPAITARIRTARHFPSARPPRSEGAPGSPSRTPLFSVNELYRYCLFHGPAFQILKDHVYVGDSDLCMTIASSDPGKEADTDSADTADNEISQTWPYLMDSIGQMAAVWLLEQGAVSFGSYPSQITSMEWFGPPPAPGKTLQCFARCHRKGEEISADFDFANTEGAVVARVRGLISRFFDFPNDYYAAVSWPGGGKRLTVPADNALASGGSSYGRILKHFPQRYFSQSAQIWLRVLAYTCLGMRERETFLSYPEGSEAGREVWLLRRIAVKDVLRDWFEREHDLRLAPADLELTEKDGLYRARYICDPEFGSIPPVKAFGEDGAAGAELLIGDRDYAENQPAVSGNQAQHSGKRQGHAKRRSKID